jgi:hypothetical protein
MAETFTPEEARRRDQMLRRLLKTPPQPRPKRERDKPKAKKRTPTKKKGK